ncbi:hypothetical protein [Pseudoalteromonas sp. H105]|jgi:hypothetical protein|uniref:hypothetical protein n=1 Tax=Pseudoalteromonas sp. H105 TaxID=1348393 RepID=UPI000732448C|nr:hypothetical protein [Pseudoalteromonas sp. H105]KTF18382.1 hypothetical protein ATS75_02945 [Pseudoalteromonas sp. H105]
MIQFFKFHVLRAKLQILSDAETCMPIEIFSLSRKMADFYPSPKIQILYEEFIDNDNAFVRRAMMTAIRFIGGEFAKSNVESVRSLLHDENGWVAYDAIWALSENDLINENDEKVIRKFAIPYQDLELEELSELSVQEANDYRNKMAAEVLCKFASA